MSPPISADDHAKKNQGVERKHRWITRRLISLKLHRSDAMVVGYRWSNYTPKKRYVAKNDYRVSLKWVTAIATTCPLRD
jgi:hypothetical protein